MWKIMISKDDEIIRDLTLEGPSKNDPDGMGFLFSTMCVAADKPGYNLEISTSCSGLQMLHLVDVLIKEHNLPFVRSNPVDRLMQELGLGGNLADVFRRAGV